MENNRFYFLILLVILLFTFGCISESMPDETLLVVIDNNNKIPIENAFVNDPKTGDNGFTNSSGKYKLIGSTEKQFIKVTKDGYKPFSIQITYEFDKENKKWKTFKIMDEMHWRKEKRTYEAINSDNFSVINGDTLLVELEKL